MSGRIDWHGEPEAPAANSLVPSAGACVRRGDEVLLIERTDNSNWSMPGGAMDPGESLTGCAVRETHEETGLHVAVEGVSGLYTDPGHVIQYTSDNECRQEFTVIFHARHVSGEPSPSSESRRVVWVPVDQVEGLRMDPSQRKRLLWAIERPDEVYLDPVVPMPS